jgi:quercetin dioxygenase-like cupin family protein
VDENLSEPGAYGGEAADLGRVDGAPDAMARFREVLLQSDDVEWAPKTLAGLSQKMLWRDETTGASIALVRFERGSGVPSPHAHASNQFMFCLSGRYVYTATGLTLTPGSFYWNPKGSVHGPTFAEEDSVLLEFYDGPHYPTQPDWYSDPEDAR